MGVCMQGCPGADLLSFSLVAASHTFRPFPRTVFRGELEITKALLWLGHNRVRPGSNGKAKEGVARSRSD